VNKWCYYKAAQIIDSGEEEYMCWAMDTACGYDMVAAEEFHETLLEHRVSLSGGLQHYDAEGVRLDCGMKWQEMQEVRTLFLLFLFEAAS
jgi:hypothetical protein